MILNLNRKKGDKVLLPTSGGLFLRIRDNGMDCGLLCGPVCLEVGAPGRNPAVL